MALIQVIGMNVSLKTMLWLLLALSAAAQTTTPGVYDLCSIGGRTEIYVNNVKESQPVGSVIKEMDFMGSRDQVNVTADGNNTYFRYEDFTREIKLISELDADNGLQQLRFGLSCHLAHIDRPIVDIRVNMLLQDVNDNPPVFTAKEYFVQIGEMALNQSVITTPVSATDEDDDKTSNGFIFYSIVPDTYSHYFDIRDPTRPDLTVMSRLDYESLPNFSITIMAKDQPSSDQEQFNATATLFVTVVDEDDLPPTFELDSYVGIVSELSPQGTKVNLTWPIFAYDQDVNINASIKYSIEKAPNNYFSIDPDTAVVFVNDPPPAQEYTVMVRARQVNNQFRTDTVSLKIIVPAANRKPPTFLQSSYEVHVPETLSLGSTVLTVSATDTDFGSQIQYYFVAKEDMFTLNPTSGAIKLVQALDFETTTVYVFQVAASDGQLNTTASVTVRVTDVNDNNPIISPQELEVEVERATATFITKIEATDGDMDTILSFSLASHSNLFSINAKGELVISAVPEALTENMYDVVVIVTDNGVPSRQSSAVVKVMFPVTTPTTGAVTAGVGSDVISICLGVIAATLLIIVILLAVYIVRRRLHSSEHLDKAKDRSTMDPRGLMFKKHPGSRNPSRGAIHFSHEPDGGTTVAENPFTMDGNSNYGYVHSDESENDRDMDEIQIETSVIPYGNGRNGTMFQPVEDDDGLPISKMDHSYQNGSLSTFKDSSSNDSIHSDSTNSKQGLMKNMNGIATKSLPMKKLSWAGNVADMPSNRSLNSIDGDSGVPANDEKPEITVYF